MALSALAGYGSSDSEDSGGEDASYIKSKPILSTKELIGVVREAKAGKGGKKGGVVQISVPKIKDDDLSDDEDTTVKPIQKGGTGLASLLPKPKRSQVTNKRTTSLIPPSVKKPKKATSVADHTPNDSVDSEDNSDVTFFSNLETSEPLLPRDEPIPLSIATPLPTLSTTSIGESSAHQQSYESSAHHQPYSYQALNPQPYQATDTPPTHHYGYDHYTQQSTVNYEGTNQDTHVTYPSSSNHSEPTDNDDHLKVDEAAFHRLAGGSNKRGRNRGKEEEILKNMRDISENEIKDAVAYQKYLTEEHSHTSGTVPEDLAFSNTQKRKHQIHWLAAQAKTKEQELKSFWSQAAATRRQTQMKYGF